MKGKILIFGGSGYLGKHIVKASILLGHKTYVYTRPISSSSSKIHILNNFESMGVHIVHGELSEKEKIADLIGKVDIIISVLAYPQVLDQFNIIDAIKANGNNIKRFIPSDFGIEEDKVRPLPPFEEFLEKKRKIRRAIEEAQIPYTYISANAFGGYFVNYLLHPRNRHNCLDLTVYGHGDAKAVFNSEEDIAMYTVKAADDPTTLNKLVTVRPEKNIVSQLELIDLWEKKTSLSFNKLHISQAKLAELSQSLPYPESIKAAILECLFAKGEMMSYELEESDIEASELYPDYTYTTIDQLVDNFLVNPPSPAFAAF